MNINKFTQKSMQAVQDCEKLAYQYGNQEIDQEHLIVALLHQEDSTLAKNLDPSSETQRTGDTTVTATVEENSNKADYIISIPETVDFGKIQQPETEGNAYSYKDITVSCIKADNLGAGNGIAVLVKDATAAESSDPFCLTHNTHSDCVLNYEIMNNNDREYSKWDMVCKWIFI